MNTATRIALAVSAAIAAAPAGLRAQTINNVWSNPSAAIPTISTIVGGPWTLGAYNAPRNVVSAPPAATDYCVNGVENFAANTTPTVMAPFYFPFILGSGQNLFGYFNYRPSSLNEATIAAKSTDGGKSWSFLQQALQINTATTCPASNSPSQDDTGLGHPFYTSFAGKDFLYLLDRRGGHVDNDGLVVKVLTPNAAAPLNANPPLNQTVVQAGPVNNTGVIAGWTFDGLTSGANINNPPADLGPHASTAVAKALGMTNNYWCSATPNVSKTPAGYRSIEYDDIVADSGSSVTPSNDWRVRGQGTTTTAVQGGEPCNGWDLDAPQYSQGAEFDVDTTGTAKVLFEYDWYSTAQGFHNLQVQYNLNAMGAANSAYPNTWVNFGITKIAVAKGWNNQSTVDFSTVAGAGNNPNFGVRLVGAYDPTLPAGSYTTGNDPAALNPALTKTVNFAAGQEYTGATTAANGAPAIYNDNSGNWRFDNVKFYDATQFAKDGGTGTTTTDYAVETTGLLNPDGILAAIPNTYPRKVLYIQKQLSAALAANACPSAGPGGKINYDIDTIRLAKTVDGVHFTDLGATNLLDPTTTSNLGTRYAAPNGSIVKYYNGKIGLFFGAGNCEDGDSDGFHAIVYAEPTDGTYLNWTYVNSMQNPIAEISYSAATPTSAPLTGVSSKTNGQQNFWFGGRVYTPNAIFLDNHHVSLIFAGYNYGYFGTDLTSYRTIGQITLTSQAVLTP